MPKVPSIKPRFIPLVMVSSTFTDLKEHRDALIGALIEHGLHPNAIEFESAKPAGDVIDSSLQMVRDSAVYVVLISQKYGQIPVCPTRNPDQLSITELEFNEAQRLNRPTLLYIMSKEHAVKKADIEPDPAKEAKLDAFRERAKQDPVSKVNRVYAVFESLEEFKFMLRCSLHDLCNHMDQQEAPAEVKASSTDPADCKLPAPPAFYAASLQGKIVKKDFDVFLCHNSDDKPAIKLIGDQLKDFGILPWLDEWELRPGLPWQRSLEEQIKNIKAAAVFIGKKNTGPWQDTELDAFLREFVRRNCPVIPVLLADCGQQPALPVFLQSMTWVDFRQPDPDPMSQLIWGITGLRAH
jgi:hypothetical protein